MNGDLNKEMEELLEEFKHSEELNKIVENLQSLIRQDVRLLRKVEKFAENLPNDHSSTKILLMGVCHKIWEEIAEIYCKK